MAMLKSRAEILVRYCGGRNLLAGSCFRVSGIRRFLLRAWRTPRRPIRCPRSSSDNPTHGESSGKQEGAVRKLLHAKHYAPRDNSRSVEWPGAGTRELNAETKPVPGRQDPWRNGAESASAVVPGDRFEFEPIAFSLLAPHPERDRLIESQCHPSLDHRTTLPAAMDPPAATHLEK